MALNEDQKDYCRFLGTIPPEQKCWCGWYRKEECGSWCNRAGRELTCADKLKLACPDCGGLPWDPDEPPVHKALCPRRMAETRPTEGRR